MIEEIRRAILNDGCIYGIRVDDFDYEIGDTCNVSHELFQDPKYDANDNLLYPYCETGIYAGYYDAGELNGTSALEINGSNIDKALEQVKMYMGKNIYIIKGENYENGNDLDEIIIEDAVVVAKFEVAE